ncbi:MAG: hypoxanthine phosphoribosyltransferase [Clostridiales bacterium]|jgi:hypoxanthine phosphoribosyltransferase|nr:hypoxanthine phosphoribosyltransferase [Clostridiales bacterium]
MELQEIYGKETVRARIKELADEIKKWLPKNETLVCLCVLRGAIMFFVDLVRELEEYDVRLDFVSLVSYGDATSSSGKVTLLQDIRENVEGKRVLIVEDIVDSGYTLQYLKRFFSDKNVKEFKIACLLDKPCRQVDVNADYTAFKLDSDRYVVGYGLDAAQKYRNLNGIYEVK